MARGTPRTLVIDAHNACYRDPELRRLIQQDPERARRALEALVGDRPWHLFYDGGPGGMPHTRQVGRLQLHYAGSGDDRADQAIRMWLEQHGGRGVVVVSDDRALRASARNHGARLEACDDWLQGLRDKQQRAAHQGRTTATPEAPPPGQDEVAFWLEQFGEDPCADEP